MLGPGIMNVFDTLPALFTVNGTSTAGHSIRAPLLVCAGSEVPGLLRDGRNNLRVNRCVMTCRFLPSRQRL